MKENPYIKYRENAKKKKYYNAGGSVDPYSVDPLLGGVSPTTTVFTQTPASLGLSLRSDTSLNGLLGTIPPVNAINALTDKSSIDSALGAPPTSNTFSNTPISLGLPSLTGNNPQNNVGDNKDTLNEDLNNTNENNDPYIPSGYQYDVNSSAYRLGQGISNARNGEGGLGNTLFNIAAPALSAGLSLARSVASGYTTSRMSNQIERRAQQRVESAKANDYTYNAEGGVIIGDERGQMGIDEQNLGLLTGEMVPSFPDSLSDEANVFVEDGEYIIQSTGLTQEVEGKKHNSQGTGGTPMNIQDVAAVISDQLKIGPDLAKSLRQNYNIKAKPTDTYATILDRYKSQSGLSKAYADQEELLKRLKKNEDKVADENTKNINREYLSGLIKESEEEIAPLEAEFSHFSKIIFNEQEREKNGDHVANFFAKYGGKVFSDDKIERFAKRYNLSMDEAKAFIYQNRKVLPQFAAEGMVFNPFRNRYDTYNNEFSRQSTTNSGFGNVNDTNIQGIYNELARQFPSLTRGDSAILSATDGNYFLNQGRSINDLQRSIQSINEANRNLASDVSNSEDLLKFLDENQFVDEAGNVRGFDGKLGNFTSSRSSIVLDVINDENKLKSLNEAGIYNLSDLVYTDNASKAKQILGDDEYNKFVSQSQKYPGADYRLGFLEGTTSNQSNTPNNNKTDNNIPKEEPLESDLKERVNSIVGNRRVQFQNPSRYFATPTLLELPSLQQVGYTPIAAQELDIPYQEIYGAGEQALDSLDTIADNSRIAGASRIAASMAENINRAYADIAPRNVQSRLTADQYNAQMADNTERVNVQLGQSYDASVGMAKANREEEIRRYYDAINRQSLANYQSEVQLNMINDLYSNFYLDENGRLVQRDNSANISLPTQVVARRVITQNQQSQQNNKKRG